MTPFFSLVTNKDHNCFNDLSCDYVFLKVIQIQGESKKIVQ